MFQVAELYSYEGGFTASDPEDVGTFTWRAEAELETSAVFLLTIDQHALEDQSGLLSEELDLAPTPFVCSSGLFQVCAVDDHESPCNQFLRVQLLPGQHTLKVLRLTWNNPPKQERLYPEDLLVGAAIATILLGTFPFLLSLLLLILATLLYILQSLSGWQVLPSLSAHLWLLLKVCLLSLVTIFVGAIMGKASENLNRVKQRRDQASKFRLTRPDFWLQIDTKQGATHASS